MSISAAPFPIIITDCLVSYATENVMRICHGHRKCTLSADSNTFGKPCRPESRMYLKVVYTCGMYHHHAYFKVSPFYTQKRKIQATIYCL